jgi:hypothetical protein
MRFRLPKVRITDMRTICHRRNGEQLQHDKMVAVFDEETLRRMEADLSARRLRYAKSPENRWAAARLEAIRHRLGMKGDA